MSDDSRRRRRAAAAIAATCVICLVGGATVLTFSYDDPPRIGALKPRSIHPAITPERPPIEPPPASSGSAGFGMGFGDTAAAPLASPAGYAGAPPAPPSLPALQLPAPSQLPALPPVEDWLALLQPYIQSYIDGVSQAVAADIAESIVGDAFTNVIGFGLNTAFSLGNLILLIAYLEDDRGPDVLTQLQSLLPAAVLPPLAAEAPLPDFGGLTAAFAAIADAPGVLGPVALPQLPPLPQLPQLPRAEDVAAGIAAAVGPLPQLPPLPRAEDIAAGIAVLSQLPPPQLPQLPPPPPGPRAEDIAAGVVGIMAVGFVLSLFAPQPPSLTKMLGLPF